MTIEKGRRWGLPYEGSSDLLTARDDGDLAASVAAEILAGTNPVYSVDSGDVARSLGYDPIETDGLPTPALWSSISRTAYDVDLGWLDYGESPDAAQSRIPFVAHVLGHRRFSVWPELIVMNAPSAGATRFGPRAHLNDGLLDITTGTLPRRQATEAQRRAISGSHLPHPALTTVRTSDFETTFEHSLELVSDGIRLGRWRWIRVTVQSDAFRLVLPPPKGSGNPSGPEDR